MYHKRDTPMSKTAVIHVRTQAELKKKVVRIATRKKKTPSEFIRDLLADAVRNDEQQLLARN